MKKDLETEVLQALTARGAATPRWLAHHLGAPTTAVNATVRKLVASGVLIPVDEHAHGRVVEATAVTVIDPQRLARAA